MSEVSLFQKRTNHFEAECITCGCICSAHRRV